ncbi:hypothetical protein MPSEU_000558500 [Mayamaea pseudoterrestris]|nr:hypothetical protein MPSEU_000558500 [Mayamaea pseudoterrestris]
MQPQTTQSWTKTQLALLLVVLFLAVDDINPIKLVLTVFPEILPWHIASVSLILIVYIFVSDIKELVYFGLKVFFKSILSIFFRQVEIVGRENIPRYGPVIFSVNHANQFMDAVMVVCGCENKVSYLMAEASWRRPIIGHIAWALDVVPVKRAQDDARQGTGKIQLADAPDMGTSMLELHGQDTCFTRELSPGDKIRPPETAHTLKVVKVLTDTSVLVEENSELSATLLKKPVAFDILKYTPLNVVFARVLERLAAGGAVGIFPEGGSHDRTDLLPLKVGVALIAYSAYVEHGMTVPIVPVGLNYFRAHRWRGRAIVEYGKPLYIDPNNIEAYKAGGQKRKKVCNDLLQDIEASMRSVIVSTSDYETMQLILTARRLYVKTSSTRLDPSEKQDLTRRFAEGYRRLLEVPEPPKEWTDLQDRLKAYYFELRDLGIKDYQVPALMEEHLDETVETLHVDGDRVLSTMQLFYHIVHLLIVLALAAVPILFLNLPVGILASWWAERRRKKALAASKVKIKGYDVMLTEKVLFCLVMVPSLWILYIILLYTSTNLTSPEIALCILSMPVFAYVGIIVTDAGFVDWQHLRAYYMRLFPSARKRLAVLPFARRKLQADLRSFIKSIGPAMGEIYYEKNLDWKAIQEKSRKEISVDKKAL